jgi:site-specific DNA-methyltransferase (adenine-specific)
MPVPNKILTGDCLVQLPKIPDNSVQLIIADPPYFNVLDESWDRQWPQARAYLDWCARWIDECMRVLKPDGLFYCFGQLGKREHTFLHLMSETCRRHQFHDQIVWDRVVGYNERRDSFTPSCEMILVLRKSPSPKFFKEAVREPYDDKTIQTYLRDPRYKDKERRIAHLRKGKFATNLWSIPSLKGSSREKCGHPSQKPEKLVERIVLSSSSPGDLVLDPFLGSGTTAFVAQKHDRSWLGIELDPAYIAMAKKRLESPRFQNLL